MRQQVIKTLKQKGQSAIIPSIDSSIRDLKQARYSHGEIKETIRDVFFGLDSKIDSYIVSKGY